MSHWKSSVVLAAALVCPSHFAVNLHCVGPHGEVVDTPKVCASGAGTDFLIPAELPLPATCSVAVSPAFPKTIKEKE